MTFLAFPISKHRKQTPEGYWIIEGTPFARIGIQEYAAAELPHLKAEADGIIRVNRFPEDVFDPDSISSWNGKPLTNDHPPELVNPTTWRSLSRGMMLNPRPGTGDDEGLLVGDLVVTDAGAMLLIDAGKVELSGGYNPEYVEFEPGKYKQTNIIGNHIALVAEGRCGPLCAVRDGAIQHCCNDEENDEMDKTLKARLMKLLGVTTDAALQAALDAEPAEAATGNEPLALHIHTGGAAAGAKDADDPMEAMGARIGAMEDVMRDVAGWMKSEKDAKLARDAAEEKERKEKEGAADATEGEAAEMAEEGGDAAMKDSATLASAFQGTLALAEIIAPGIPPLATVDAKAPRKSTLDALCAYRKKALELIGMTPQGRLLVEEVNGGKTFDAAGCKSCAKVRSMFLGVGAAMKRLNNAASGGGGRVFIPAAGTGDAAPKPINSISDLSRRAETLYPTREQRAAH